MGYEMVGRVVAVGRDVKAVSVGDRAVFTVRRPCRTCPACAVDRSDMCYTATTPTAASATRTGIRLSSSSIGSSTS